MTTADWALIISLCSFAVSLFGLVWNVWSKFIFPQPQVRIGAGVYIAISQDFTSPHFVSARMTNYGPGEVTITHAVGRARERWWKREQHFLWKIAASPEPWNTDLAQFDAFGFGLLPHKMAVGEQFTLNAHLGNQAFDPSTSRVGFSDTYGRTHWLGRRQLRALLKKVGEERKKAGLPLKGGSGGPPEAA